MKPDFPCAPEDSEALSSFGASRSPLEPLIAKWRERAERCAVIGPALAAGASSMAFSMCASELEAAVAARAPQLPATHRYRYVTHPGEPCAVCRLEPHHHSHAGTWVAARAPALPPEIPRCTCPCHQEAWFCEHCCEGGPVEVP